METEKITICEKYNEGTSIDVLEQEKLRKGGKRPVGVAFATFDEAISKTIYYTIDRVVYFDTVRITVVDKFQRWNYLIYRIDQDNNKLIYDPISSVKGQIEKGEIKEIRFLNTKEEETCIFYKGEGYKGKI